MKWVAVLFILLLTCSSFCVEEEESNDEDNSGKVKGQYYSTETTITKIVGAAGFSEEFLQMFKNEGEGMLPFQNITLVIGAQGSDVPYLVSEKTKTIITKISIPLTTNYTNNPWYWEALKKFLKKNQFWAPTSNTTEEHFSRNGTDVNLIVLNLFTAASLRDNIIRVFGNLLYHPKNILLDSLRGALLEIITMIRLRRVDLTNCLEMLEAMVHEDIHDQFVILFEHLEFLVPKYVRSSVTYWLECLYKQKINIEKVVKNHQVDLNFFHNIQISALTFADSKIEFSESEVQESWMKNEQVLGHSFSYIFAEITQRRLILTSQLFAGILGHLPLNTFSPEVDESERYIIDTLKEINGEQFARAISGVRYEELANPFNMVKEVLKCLMTVNVFANKKMLEDVILDMDMSLNPYLDKNHIVMSSLLSGEHLNVDLLLNGMIIEDYPVEITEAKKKLQKFIREEIVTIEPIFRDFPKNAFTNPKDLLIAALTRIAVKTYHSNPEISSCAETLKVNFLFRNAQANLRLALSIPDLITLLSYFQGYNTPPEVQKTASELKFLLHLEQLNLQQNLIGHSVLKCFTPLECTVSTLKCLISLNIVKHEGLKIKINEMLNMIDSDARLNALNYPFRRTSNNL